MQKAIKITHSKPELYANWLDENYEQLMARLEPPYNAGFKPGQAPSAEKKAQLLQRLAQAEQHLNAAIEPGQLAKFLEILFCAFASKNSVNSEATAGAYIFALGEFSHYTIEKALQNFLKGLVPEQNLTYAPSPAMFASHCRFIQRDYEIKIRLMRRKLELKEIR